MPAILALAFTLILTSANYDVDVWMGRAWLSNGLDKLSLFDYQLLLFGVLVFPDGRMSRMAWATAGSIAIWTAFIFAVPMDTVYAVSDPIFIALLAMVLVRQLLRYRSLPPGSTRQQVRWSIFGFASGGICLMIMGGLYLAATWIGGAAVSQLEMAASITFTLASLCIAGGLIVSLMRYRLYDADAVIGRSAAYGVLTLGFVAVFAGSQKAIEALGETYFGGQIGALAGALGAAVAAVLVVPPHRRVNDWAERRFQKGLLRLRLGLPRLVGDLRETAPPDRIADTVAEAAMAGVQATRVAVLVGDTVAAARGVSPETAAGWLAERDIETESPTEARLDPLFPMRLALDAEGTDRSAGCCLGRAPTAASTARTNARR